MQAKAMRGLGILARRFSLKRTLSGIGQLMGSPFSHNGTDRFPTGHGPALAPSFKLERIRLTPLMPTTVPGGLDK
jgi:hypothetical protein